MNKEIAIKKTQLHKQQFSWKKRDWAIPEHDDKAVITDKKGNYHLFVDVNESDGIIRIMHPRKDNVMDDKCGECGGKISIDASNVHDLIKRKTITTFWGIDNTFTLLLILIGIISLGAMGFAFYLFGENEALRQQVTILQNQLLSRTQ